MKYLSIIVAFLIASCTASWAQENSEERLNEVIELRGQTNELKTLKKAWNAYKLGDFDAAFDLWMPLAELGNSAAQVLVGLMYAQGHGVKQDKKEAEKWYVLASEQSYTPAKWRLAMLYYHGSGLTQNYQKAADLYHSAAKQGDIYSQKALGIMYSKGFGVQKDKVLAYSWFWVANKNGFKLAQIYQNKVAQEMTPEEMDIAQAMAEECLISHYKKCGWILSTDGNLTKNGS